MSTGNIVQIIGTVVDVEFPRESIPKVYEALTLKGGKLVFEVQQQLGDGVVRTIAMGSSEGLKRGLEVGVGKLKPTIDADGKRWRGNDLYRARTKSR